MYFPPAEDENWAAFFVGFPAWPDMWQAVWRGGRREIRYGGEQGTPVRLDLDPRIRVIEHQVGGHSCGRRYLFGVLAELPEGDALRLLAGHYYESGIMRPTMEQLLEYINFLRELGLELVAEEYAWMTEGFLPFDFLHGAEYASEHGLWERVLASDGRVQELPAELRSAGDMEGWLRRAWRQAWCWAPAGEKPYPLAELCALSRVPLLAAVVHSNSD